MRDRIRRMATDFRESVRSIGSRISDRNGPEIRRKFRPAVRRISSIIKRAFRRATPGFIKRNYAVKFGIVILFIGLLFAAVGVGATNTMAGQVEQSVDRDFESTATSDALTLDNWLESNAAEMRTLERNLPDSGASDSAINEYLQPDSVIDFGCAIGAHLEPFYEDEVTIKGVEGNSKAFDYAVVPQEFLEEHDLRNRYEPEREYDLALCFEVAEHIPERYADTLVATLVEAGNTVVMTAATPGQGGTHHVNEQPREYWYEKFESHGYEYAQETVDDLSDKIVVDQSTWILENLMVFHNSVSLDPE